ncbi:hypothetical protein [Arthrobacter monumenti]
MTSHRIDPSIPPAGTHRVGEGPAWRRKLKYIGGGIIVLSMVPYLVLATWVNVFSPELIVSNYPFGTTDPISADVGGWTFIIGFPIGLATVLAGWIVNGYHKDRTRFRTGVRLAFGALRTAASLGITVFSVMVYPLLQLLLMVVVGRN